MTLWQHLSNSHDYSNAVSPLNQYFSICMVKSKYMHIIEISICTYQNTYPYTYYYMWLRCTGTGMPMWVQFLAVSVLDSSLYSCKCYFWIPFRFLIIPRLAGGHEIRLNRTYIAYRLWVHFLLCNSVDLSMIWKCVRAWVGWNRTTTQYLLCAAISI